MNTNSTRRLWLALLAICLACKFASLAPMLLTLALAVGVYKYSQLAPAHRFSTILWFFLPIAGLAAENPSAVAFHTDPVDVWGARFLAGTIGLGILILIFNLLRNRGTTAGPASWALLVAGVGLIPLMATGIGTLLVFERAEKVEFCESCHITMQGFADDMRNPKSESLAAVHFKNRFIPDNQCYDCHTSYGMFGTAEAKMAGVVDVYKYFTHTYANPIAMRKPYPNHDCLKCHAESAKWLKHDEHIAVKDDLFADRMKCLDCHGVEHPAHPESVRKVAAR